MADFDIIEFGYNAADETINFGTRCLAEGDNLYEAATLATLKTSEPNENVKPHINAVVQDEKLYLSIDASMRIFSDKQCSDVTFNASFAAIIDCFCLSPKADYMLICCRDNMLHLIDCIKDYECVFRHKITSDDEPDRFFINVFLDCGAFLIVTKQGQVYRMVFETEFIIDLVHEFNFKTEIASFKAPILLVNGAKLAIFDVDNKNVLAYEGEELKKVFPLNRFLFLALDSIGNLFRICCKTLLTFPIYNSAQYKDIQVIYDSDQKQIVALREDEIGQNHLEVLTFPDFKQLYSIKVSNDIHLMSLDSLTDELLYISKIYSNNSLTELRIHVLYETEPDQRLLRLLKKRKFDEAEKFAKLFNLDPSLINRAKAKEIIDKTTCTSEDINNLINILNTIDDDEFRLQSCLDVEPSCGKFEDIRKILMYGCTLHLRKSDKKSSVEDLQKSVAHLMYRFDTFFAVKKGSEQAIHSWLQFCGCDLIQEVKFLLHNHQTEEAKIIYSRLDEITTDNLTELDVSEILDVLNKIPLVIYESFLPIFISVTLSILPSTLPLFVKWTYSKVFYLENRGKADFPNNAIRFTENIVALMRRGDIGDISFQRQFVLHRESLLEFSTLLTALKTLKILKEEYRITIPIVEYLAGPQHVVRFLLNVEMCPEDYDHFLKRFLCRYIVENHMEPNEIFLGEVMDLMKYEERYWVHIIESILSCINSVHVKLTAIKSILDFASVPWSDTVRRIATDSLQFSHSLTAEIRELIEGEPIQVVLRKPKYKIKERKIESLDDLKFVVRRIIYCDEPTMLEDIYKLCKNSEYRRVINILLISHFISIGCLEKAVDVLDNNPPEEIYKSAQELACLIETMLNNSTGLPDQLINNYYDIAKPIFKRLNDLETNDCLRFCNDRTLDLIRNVYSLRKHFKIEATSYDLRDFKSKMKIINFILEETKGRLESSTIAVTEALNICHKLATSLSLDEAEILLKFCEKTSDYNVILRGAQKIYDLEASPRNLCLIAVLLLKNLGTYRMALLDNSLDETMSSGALMDPENVVDDEAFCEGLKMAQVVISKAIAEAQPEDLLACFRVANWVNTSFYFSGNHNWKLRQKLFGDLYDSPMGLSGCLTFTTIKNVFVAFCEYLSTFNDPNNFYLTKFNDKSLTEEQFLTELKMLPPIFESMCKEGQHFTAFKILKTLINSLMEVPAPNPTILNCLNLILTRRLIPKLLSSAFSKKIIDDDLVYNLVISCDHDESAKIILHSWKMYKRHPRKFQCITNIGLKFWEYCKLVPGKTEMLNALKIVKWWKKFEFKKFHYDTFCKMKSEDRFEVLVNSDCLDMALAAEYCEDFKLDSQNSYKYFLKKILVNWKPDYQIKSDGNKKALVVRNSENDLLLKCEEIIKFIDKQDVFAIIMNNWNSINTYYYEVFIAMLTIMSRLDPKQDNSKKLAMLAFLKNYQRSSKPSDTEIEQWYTIFPDTQTVDPLSEFRLAYTPFLFNKQIFDILRPEFNLKTYRLWFDVIDILKPYLKKDEICSFVVKDVVASGAISKNVTEEWVFHAKYDDLFEEIDKCVLNISDLEWSTSVIYHVVIHTPPGADQVNAAKLCYKYALKYRKMNPDSNNVEKAFNKVEKKYFTYSAMHILHIHRLAEKKYMDLLTQPKELILALYLDERILKKVETDFHPPEINKATEALAELYGLDIGKLRIQIIHDCLNDDISTSRLDFETSIICSGGSCSEDENLNRVAYICCSGDVEYWQTQLLHLGLGSETEEQRSVHCKARALKVFAMISDVETIVKLTESTYDEFMNFIDKLTLVSNLQYLGISVDVEGLDQYNKKELLNRLVQRAGNLMAIKTMALICMTYEIYDVKYWEFIINNAVHYSMFSELKTYVTFLKNVKYQYKQFYIKAWQKIVDNSFVNLHNNPDQLDQVLLSNFLMIQSCPVLYSLNLDNAFRKCMDRDKAEFAAVLLQYFDISRRDVYVEQIRNSHKDLVASLNNLDQKGLWGVCYVKMILAQQ